MQTFIPFNNLGDIARCLDRQRLGKQRVECKQIYKALTQSDYGWQHHPATKMWKGYEQYLLGYMITMCNEWVDRGYVDNKCLGWAREKFNKHHHSFVKPWWWGHRAIIATHRGVLLAKDYQHYSQFGWNVLPLPKDPDTGKWPYYWPV